MKDPCRNAELQSSFSFTGTIAGIEETAKRLDILIHQECIGGRLPTDYKLVIPRSAVTTENFPYIVGDTVLVEDALVYKKDSEVRLRIDQMEQIRSTSANPGELNSLSFSGKIADVKEEAGYKLVTLKQTVKELYETSLEVIITDTLKMEHAPKVGDIGLISHALFYEKGGTFRAKLTRPTYQVLYTPDVIMDLGTIEAKELFV